MAGFGKQKSINKKKSSITARMKPEQLRAHAIQQHMSGNISSAEIGYKAYLNSGFNDPDVLSNYALICQESGRLKKALELYQKCLSFYPNHSFANANLAYLYLSLGELDKAEKTIN